MTRSSLSIIAFCGMVAMLGALLVWGEVPGASVPALAQPQLCIGAGDSGGVPSIAFIPAGATPIVIIPGSISDALELRNALQQRGYDTLELLLMPTRSPHAKGATTLARGFTIRQFTALRMKNTRLDWRQLRDELLACGTALTEVPVESASQGCDYAFEQYVISYRQLRDGLFAGQLRLRNATTPLFTFELLRSGEMQITPSDGEIVRIAKSSRAHTIVIPLSAI